MASRRTRWIGLGLDALSFLFLANNGCDVVLGLKKHPPNDNALRCACTCLAPANHRDRAIAAGSDDAEQDATKVMTLNGTTLDFGQLLVGLRFTNLNIPRGATITHAVVQLLANNSDSSGTDLKIYAQASVDPPTFSAANDDLGGRAVGAAVDWPGLPPWVGGTAQQTPDLKAIVQPLVDDPDWSETSSSIVLRFEGTGHRRASTIEGNAARAPVLIVDYDTTVKATLPICASEDVDHDVAQRITAESQAAECARVQDTLTGLAAACGYPTPCTCAVLDIGAPDGDSSFQSDVCYEECTETLPDAACTNFDPNAFVDCLQQPQPLSVCKELVSATNAEGGSPVCVASGSALAYHAFGERSQCDVTGTSDIQVGDREPTHNPDTEGTVELLGGPCAEGGCQVLPYFDLAMEQIEFEVRYHSNPTFFDLSASGAAIETATVSNGEATFGEETVEGTGNGRRGILGIDGLAVVARNEEPLVVGIDWTAKLCDMNGNLVTVVDSETPDGVCAGDGTTACEADSPDCDGNGDMCVFETDTEEQMVVDVALSGKISNQPPHAVAGDDQTVECTSTAGASFVIDGGGSSDRDDDLAAASWRAGGRLGTTVSSDLGFVAALGVGQSETYRLLLFDSHAQTDADDVTVSVQDTTLPVIACNAPTTIRPPVRPISFTASATDVCDADVAAQVVAFDCFKIQGNGTRIDKRSSCGATFQGGTLTIRNKGGNGDHVQWTVRAQDDSGNLKEVVCEVLIVS